MPSKRQCCFCDNLANSQEHIWSQWILDILPEGKNGVFTRRFPDGTFKSWPAKKPEQTAGIVCEKSCNNGWMSNKLENPMKAVTKDIIINQTAKSFSPSDCAVIAAWAFKTTVLSNHIDLADKEPFFSADQRRSFAQNLTIPKGVQAWIARRNAGHLSARYFAKKKACAGTPESPNPTPDKAALISLQV